MARWAVVRGQPPHESFHCAARSDDASTSGVNTVQHVQLDTAQGPQHAKCQLGITVPLMVFAACACVRETYVRKREEMLHTDQPITPEASRTQIQKLTITQRRPATKRGLYDKLSHLGAAKNMEGMPIIENHGLDN